MLGGASPVGKQGHDLLQWVVGLLQEQHVGYSCWRRGQLATEADPGFGKGFVRGSEDRSPPSGVQGKAPVEVSGQSPQKPMISCKLYYSDIVQKKATVFCQHSITDDGFLSPKTPKNTSF